MFQSPMNDAVKADAVVWCWFIFLCGVLAKPFLFVFFPTPTGNHQKHCGRPSKNGGGAKAAAGEGGSAGESEVGSGPIQEVEEGDSL